MEEGKLLFFSYSSVVPPSHLKSEVIVNLIVKVIKNFFGHSKILILIYKQANTFPFASKTQKMCKDYKIKISKICLLGEKRKKYCFLLLSWTILQKISETAFRNIKPLTLIQKAKIFAHPISNVCIEGFWEKILFLWLY